MKRKAIIVVLLGLLAIGSIIPASVGAAESWNYGLDKTSSPMAWYNNYWHSSYVHYGSITKNGVTWFGPRANPGYWSNFRLEVNGPYAVTYDKHIVRY